MHTRPEQTDEQTNRQTVEHHGNNATIRSTNASRAKKARNNIYRQKDQRQRVCITAIACGVLNQQLLTLSIIVTNE